MKRLLLLIIAGLSLLSCGIVRPTASVRYQALKNTRQDLQATVPKDAKIALFFFVSSHGTINCFAKNLTDEILTLDRTKSFYVSSEGQSKPFYDPTIYATTSSVTTSRSTGGSFGMSLGAVSAALGIGGVPGTLLSGASVGLNSSVGTATTNSSTQVMIDQKEISIAPNAEMQIASFKEPSIGMSYLITRHSTSNNLENIISFTVSYSFETLGSDRITTKIATTQVIAEETSQYGRVNDALRRLIIQENPDKHWWMYFVGPIEYGEYTGDYSTMGFIYDYK